MKPLTRNEVTFEITVEPEYESPEGFFSYDTEEENDEAVAWIRDQLDSGNDLAWCSVLVTARPNDPRLLAVFEGFSSLGAVSCSNRADFDRLVAYYGLEDEALSHLNEKLASVQSALRSRR
jgi:hypothetical protein